MAKGARFKKRKAGFGSFGNAWDEASELFGRLTDKVKPKAGRRPKRSRLRERPVVAAPASSPMDQCTVNLLAAINQRFGAHGDNAEIAIYLMNIARGKSMGQAEADLQAAMAVPPLSHEIPQSHQAVLIGMTLQAGAGACIEGRPPVGRM